MKKKKVKVIFLTLMVTIGMIEVFTIISGVSGTTSIDTEPYFEWGFNLTDFIGVRIEEIQGPLVGQTRFLGYNITESKTSFSPWPWWSENLTLTNMDYSSISGNVENTENLLIYLLNTSIAPSTPFFSASYQPQASYYPMVVPFLVLPVNLSSTLDLDYWGKVLSNAFIGGYNTWYNLTEYSVNGNELKVFNSTTGYYINATYNLNNGTIISAESKVLMVLEQYTVEQNYSRFYDPNEINPIDETVLSPTVGDSLIYKKGSPTSGWEYASYNVTWNNITTIDYQGGPKTVRQVNATRYNWNVSSEQWDIDEDRWDENEGEWRYAHINKSIGSGNDDGFLGGMEDQFYSLVYPVGMTGDDLNSSYYPSYSAMMGLSESETGQNWLKLSNNSANVWIYFELDTNTGLLTNFTMFYGGGMLMIINSSLEELPIKGTSPFNYPSTGGIIYEVLSDGVHADYVSYNITGEVFTRLEESGIFAWIVNASKYDWVKQTSSWDISVEEGASGAIGAANGVQNYQIMDGIMNMIWGENSTGDDIDNAYNFAIMVYNQIFDTVLKTTNSCLYTNSTDDNLLYLELFSNGNVYNLTFHGDMGSGPAKMTYLYIGELPVSAYLHIPDVPVLLISNQTITTESLLIEWDAVVGADSYTLKVNGVPVLTDTGDIYYNYTFPGNGVYIITVTAKNQDGESGDSDSVTITVAIPPDASEPPAIPGYNNAILFFILITGIGAIVYALKKKSKLY
ncbi:hypothetical protein LCGC14_1206020 [marine sediment metagenome]|uniref:Fibronectin type-III domain-containing protein n=1 Tax=marine sediment metagenome TaxID=412755 RepID=A0A0F9M2V4_9ZZZZ